MTFRTVLLAATVLAAPLAFSHAASAQPVTGPYVNLGAGYNITNTVKEKNLIVDNAAVPGKGDVLFKNGYDVDAAVGYGFGNGFRAEIEGDFGHSQDDKMKIAGTDFGAAGHEERYGAFINGYYDFDIGLPYLFPYVGAGIGYQDTNLHEFAGPLVQIDKTKGTLAYQGIVGLSYPIAQVPGLSATVEYRFIGLAGSRKFDYGVAGLPATDKFGSEYNNEIRVGVRYQLYTPQPPAPAPTPAAPVAAPAPAPAKTYLVFFDWDKYNLTPRATQIIAEAASDSHTNNVTTINVSGYTDTSGTADYNMGLSQRRAQSVAAQLVTDGVPQSEIEIHAFGETHLLVPTGPGVREPQNRRVEIVLQ
jgi:outer membrane protein OmpA-like peptidoglycan-associated protein